MQIESENSIHSSSDDGDANGGAQLEFAQLLENSKILFNKSQAPDIKHQKEIELKKILKSYQQTFGRSISEKQLKKKMHNMKAEVKKKIDLKQTGNRRIKLKKWQQTIADIIQVKNNPSFTKLTNPISVGFTKPDFQEPVCPTITKSNTTTQSHVKTLKLDTRKNICEDETDETKYLSTSQLQRLVLVKQLQLITLQIAREKEFLNKQYQPNVVMDSDDNMVLYEIDVPEINN